MKIRETLLVWLYDKSKTIYANHFKKQVAWQEDKQSLLAYPKGSLGFALGKFLDKNHFSMEPKLESHDVFHTIIGFETKIEDELAMQYFLMGNGKRSLYMFMVLIPGSFLFPEQWYYFKKSYQRGKETPPFYHWDFYKLLPSSLENIQQSLFNINSITT
jgi:ubiquinone biosynthesis protein Coq4